MDAFATRGGLRIGWAHAGWPLALLEASAERLMVRGFMLGTYEFAPGDVVALEPYGLLPSFFSGTRIVHAKASYPVRIVFWAPTKPEALIERIRNSGFVPSAPASSAVSARGFPFRWSAAVLVIGACCALILADVRGGGASHLPGTYTVLALLLVFSASFGILVSPELQRLALRDGHHMGEVQALLSVLRFISGILLVVVGLMLVLD